MASSISHARPDESKPVIRSCLPSGSAGLSAKQGFGVLVTALAALILLALPSVVQAQEALAYGRDFLRLPVVYDAPVSAPVQTTHQADAMPAADQADLYLEQISALERQAGPYSAGLDEPLFALARTQRATGDVAGALASYSRAMHLVRVNEGLYSERQLPLVREVLDLYRELGDFAALDQRYDYFFRLYGAGQPPFDEVRLRAVLEYLRWQREALALELESPGPERRLLNLYELNKSVLKATNDDPDVSGAWRIALLESQFANMYLLQEHIKPKVTESLAGGGTATTRQFYGVAGMEEADPLESRMLTLKRTLVSKGRGLVEDLLAQSPNMEPQQRGRVELLLADWYQWNLMRSRAAEHYARAYELVESSGEREALDALFSEPVELPDNGAFARQSPVGKANSAESILGARFKVSERGRAVDIVVSVKDETLRGKGIRLRRQLSQTAFRPRYTELGAQPSEILEREYQVYSK
ncbi:MAG: hypothetical protein ABJ084_08405 [Halioglobus sp.]